MERNGRNLLTPELVHDCDERESQILLAESLQAQEFLSQFLRFGLGDRFGAIEPLGKVCCCRANPVAELACLWNDLEMGSARLLGFRLAGKLGDIAHVALLRQA